MVAPRRSVIEVIQRAPIMLEHGVQRLLPADREPGSDADGLEDDAILVGGDLNFDPWRQVIALGDILWDGDGDVAVMFEQLTRHLPSMMSFCGQSPKKPSPRATDSSLTLRMTGCA